MSICPEMDGGQREGNRNINLLISVIKINRLKYSGQDKGK